MSLQPSPPAQPAPGPLLAVACPACFGAVAVEESLCGKAVACPLCGGGFRVPSLTVASVPPPPAAVAGGKRPARRTHPVSDDPPAATIRRRHAPPESVVPPPAAVLVPAAPPPWEQPPGPPPGAEEAASDPALRFREPVRTLATASGTVELRRLSREEKSARRLRRNAFMLIGGVSLLLSLVLLMSGRRPKRR